MSKERISEIKEIMHLLERRIKPLEWDANRNQINEFKKKTLEKLREEHQNLLNELKELEQ